MWPPSPAEGLRVLAVARARMAYRKLARARSTTSTSRFIGLVGLADPLRPEVPAAVARLC